MRYEFTENGGDKIWIGREDKAFAVFDPLSQTFTSYENNQKNDFASLAQSNVLAIYRDRSGIIWIGTARDGLFKYDPQKDGFSNYHPIHEKIHQSTQMNLRFVFEDSQGALWIAQKGLFRCNRLTGEII
ncbi:hypothetical protein H8E88_19460 [candidate division KSB1 bacterium]|nr:hypothetical protein [candidate division KSB1 bacterium]